MTTQNLYEFFREKLAHSTTSNIDWDAKKKEWIAAIDDLYRMIVDKYLAAPIASGSVRVEYRPKTITEDVIGTYSIPELVLRVGDETAVLSPKGRNIVGASGRVDLQGEMGEATLVLQPGSRWGLVAQRVPTVRVVELNEKSLLSALQDVMRP